MRPTRRFVLCVTRRRWKVQKDSGCALSVVLSFEYEFFIFLLVSLVCVCSSCLAVCVCWVILIRSISARGCPLGSFGVDLLRF